MFYANCSNCQEKIEYGTRQSANAAKRSKVECKKCREKKKAELFEIESKRTCPKCNLTIQYKSPYLARVAEKKLLSCISCSKRSENYSGLKRECPSCKNEIIYKSSDSATRANKFNDICKSCSLRGRPPSPQCIEAVKIANTGRKLSEEHIQIIKNANTGLKKSEETKKKISKSMSGRSFKKETLKKMSISAKNKILPSEETRLKMSSAQYKRYGTNNRDQVLINKQLYISRLKTWASRAKAKTPFCEECGSKEELHAHHIKPKCIYPELALDENNVKILCKKCHIEFHKINSLYDHQ
jgi:predicted RNA-binding Zn-ribbon protein involved in translation (DUF1610 family)